MSSKTVKEALAIHYRERYGQMNRYTVQCDDERYDVAKAAFAAGVAHAAKRGSGRRR